MNRNHPSTWFVKALILLTLLISAPVSAQGVKLSTLGLPATPIQVTAREMLRRAATAVPVTVMASPPTITVGTANANSTLLTNTSVYAPMVLPNNARLTPVSATTPVNVGGVNYIPSYISEPAIPAAPGWGVQLMSDAPACGVWVRDGAGASVSFAISYQLASATDTTLPTSTGGNYYEVKADTGSSAPRLWTFYFGAGTQIAGINCGASAGTTAALNPYKVWKAPLLDEPKVLVRTDSYGSSPNAPSRANFVYKLGEAFGLRSIVSASVGGQGYIAGGNNSGQSALQQISDISAFGQLDVLGLTLGFNDNGQTLANEQAAVTSYLTQARILHPKAIIIITGPWQAPSHGATTINTAIQNAVAAAADPGVCYVDTMAGATASNPTWQDTSGLNSTLYIIGDNTHPNAAGAAYLGQREAQGWIGCFRAMAGKIYSMRSDSPGTSLPANNNDSLKLAA